MRIPMTAVALLAGALVFSPSAAGGQNANEARIRARFAELARLYSAGDSASARAIADLWAADGTHMSLAGDGQRRDSRRAIAETWLVSIDGSSRTLSVEIPSIKWITPDVAAADVVLTFRSQRGGPPRKEALFAVMRREGEVWRIASSRMAAMTTQDATTTATVAIAPRVVYVPITNPCAAIQEKPLFDFQVTEPAQYIDQRGVSPRPVRDPAANARNRADTTVVQFVVDTAGKPVTRTINVLRSRDLSQGLRVRDVAERWLFRPAVANGCKVSQIVQTAIER